MSVRSALPASRSPSQPSASTPVTGQREVSAGVAGRDRQHLGGGRRAAPRAAQELQAAGAAAPGRRVTHAPRSRTSGAFASTSAAISSSSSAASSPSPTATDHRNVGHLLAAEAAADHDARGRGAAGRQAQPDPPRAVPARGQLHPEAGLHQQRRADGEDVVGAVEVEVERLRAGAAQRGGERRVDPRGPAELGEQHLLRPGDQPVRGAGPDALGGDEQARVGRGLQQELQAPAGAVAGVVLAVVERADLGEPEDGPRRAGGFGAERVPVAQGLGQRVRVGCRPGSRPSGEVEGGEPGVEAPVRPAGRAARRRRGPGGRGRRRRRGCRGRRRRGRRGRCPASPACPRACSARATGGVAAASASTAAASSPVTTGRQRARAGPAVSRVGQDAAAGGEVGGRARPRRAGGRPRRRSAGRRRGRPARRGRPRPRAPPTPAARAPRAGPGPARTGRAPGRRAGPRRAPGSSSVTWVGVPGWIAARAAAGTANGCGRAVRNALLRPVAGRSPSSAHSSTPRPGDQSACTTNTAPPYVRPPSAASARASATTARTSCAQAAST